MRCTASGEDLATWVERRFAHLASNLGHRIALRVREFRSGLNTIHNTVALLQLIGVSVLMWAMIAVAYKEVISRLWRCNRSLPPGLQLEIPQTQVFSYGVQHGGLYDSVARRRRRITTGHHQPS